MDGGTLQVIDRYKEMVRLGEGLTIDKHLHPDVAERALACLERMGQRLRGHAAGPMSAPSAPTRCARCRPESGFTERAERPWGTPSRSSPGARRRGSSTSASPTDWPSATRSGWSSTSAAAAPSSSSAGLHAAAAREPAHGLRQHVPALLRQRQDHRQGHGQGRTLRRAGGAPGARAVPPVRLGDRHRQLRHDQVHRRRGHREGWSEDGISAMH
jgi:hypothetical protein